jgi:PAS domain S-box-containing protein
VAKRIRLHHSITLAVLVIGLLSGTLGFGYAYWHAKQSLHAIIGLNFQELARQSADKVGLLLAKEIEWVERLGELPEVRAAVKEGVRLHLDSPELQRWREAQHQYFRSMAIVDRRGNLIGGVTSEATRTHYAQQPWWPIVFEQDRPWAGDLRLDDQGRGYWEVAVPIQGDQGDTGGALKVAVRTDHLFASALHSRIGQTGHVMLADGGGRVLICPILPPALHTKAAGFTSGSEPDGLFHRGAAWMEVEDDSHGWRGGIIGISPVLLPAPIAQERAWYVLVRQDPVETDQPALTLMWKLAGFWIGTIGLIALFGLWLAGQIVRPLDLLVKRVRRLGEGRPTPTVGTDESARLREHMKIVEIETLEASFNSLGERLELASRETRRYVNEIQNANQELMRSEEHYRTLWNHATDAKLIVDAGGTVQDINRRAEIKLGRRREDVLGTKAPELFMEQDRALFRELLTQVWTTGKEASAVETHFPTMAGATLTMELDMVPIEKAGNNTAVLLQLSDITEKKALEQQLLRSERLASLSQFASMFAHDIRNPLAGIKKTLEVLGHREELQSEPLCRLFGDLQFTTDLLLGMINDMLDVYQENFSSLPLVPSTFSVADLLHDVAHLFRSEADARGIMICPALPGDRIWLAADRRRIQRVCINLVHNALKYSPPGGRITITARPQPSPTPDVQERARGHQDLLIQVQDEGPGVAPEDLPHLFEMFFRKKDGHDLRIGRGLGLYFCRLVVEAHHGRIWAANRPAGGAVFSVLLPLNGQDPCRSGS